MLPKVSVRGPWINRFLINLFTVLLVILAYWTIGFVLDDLGQWMPPDRAAIVRDTVPVELTESIRRLESQASDLRTRQAQVRQLQANLQDSTATSQRTMQQMAELERLRLQKGEPTIAANQQAIADAQQQFLANQREYQAKTEELGQLEREEALLGEQLRVAQVTLTEAERPADEEYQRQFRRWEFAVAAAKIGLMLPLLLVAVILFRRCRGGKYAPLATGFGIAVALKTLVVMHDYFPAMVFKYLVIGASLAATVWLLVKLVRMAARPQAAWLLKQYREAYEAFFCPVCDFPIRRGPLKYLAWTRRSIKRLPLHASASPTDAAPDQPYTCPCCGTKLFEECASCHGIRHSLLTACTQCGNEKPLPATA